MKIDFDNSGSNWLDINTDSGKVNIIISAQDADNKRVSRINSVEISKEEFIKIIQSLKLT